jgi:hypothetical protein
VNLLAIRIVKQYRRMCPKQSSNNTIDQLNIIYIVLIGKRFIR